MTRRSKADAAPSGSQVRCAIYTRKSSEEGLEQEFNSLDAQREACEAYVRSQKHEGWVALPQMYDDGGISGGTLERPALQRLLTDIEAGRIDAVVVYKVDRLTRSLSDFAKIVEVFDGNGVSFVSITQAFNTTTSMGRLTLNMLLSFAQFEREVTGERIRDKIAASKQKGMWMGGLAPLGYDVRDRKLVVNEAEAGTVRAIFARYAELGSVRVLRDELEAAGVLSKGRIDRFGRERGGKPFARGALYHLLQNRLYRGEIAHKKASYRGAHQAIVDQALWDKVQSTLSERRVERETGAAAAAPSLLAGLVFDDTGERLSPTHAKKQRKRYRYYVSQSLITSGRQASAAQRRVPAGDLEDLVEERTLSFLNSPGEVFRAVAPFTPDANARDAIARAAAAVAGSWSTLTVPLRRATLRRLVARITLARDRIEIAIKPRAIGGLANTEPAAVSRAIAERDEQPLILTVSAALKRAGIEMRLVVDGPGAGRREPDRSMLRLLVRAQRFNAMIMRGEATTIANLAREAGVSPSYFTRILKLSFLAPAALQAILTGRHPLELSAKRLSLDTPLPCAWPDQIALFGLG